MFGDVDFEVPVGHRGGEHWLTTNGKGWGFLEILMYEIPLIENISLGTFTDGFCKRNKGQRK